MPFDAGNISFQICRLVDEMPDDYLERFNNNSAGALEYVKEEPQIGWVSGRHLLESRIDEETALCGGYLYLYLRTAQRKVPSSLLQAECRMEELAVLQAEKKTSLSRKQKREIKEDISKRLLPDMPPAISGIGFVIDVASSTLYLGASSISKIEMFLNVFKDSIGIDPIPLIPETLVQELLGIHINELPLLNFAPDRRSSCICF